MAAALSSTGGLVAQYVASPDGTMPVVCFGIGVAAASPATPILAEMADSVRPKFDPGAVDCIRPGRCLCWSYRARPLSCPALIRPTQFPCPHASLPCSLTRARRERNLAPELPVQAVMLAGQRPGAADAPGPGLAALHSERRTLEPMPWRRSRHPPRAWLRQPPVLQRPRPRVVVFQPLLLRLHRPGPSAVARMPLRPGSWTAAFPPRQVSLLRPAWLTLPHLPPRQRQLRQGRVQPYPLLPRAQLHPPFRRLLPWRRLRPRCLHASATPLRPLRSQAHRSCCRL
jgi:hypothetical protein